jgi:hypothetical protein
MRPLPRRHDFMAAGDIFENSTLNGFAQARQEMVETQIRRRHITDSRVLECLERVPRHEFVPAEFRNRAYEDAPLPIGEGQTISQPYIVAAMTAALRLQGSERVLEIGTGFGYQAAVLACLAREVFTIECRAKLALRTTLFSWLRRRPPRPRRFSRNWPKAEEWLCRWAMWKIRICR